MAQQIFVQPCMIYNENVARFVYLDIIKAFLHFR